MLIQIYQGYNLEVQVLDNPVFESKILEMSEMIKSQLAVIVSLYGFLQYPVWQ